MQTETTDLWAQQRRERVGEMDRVALKRVVTVCETDDQWEVAV